MKLRWKMDKKSEGSPKKSSCIDTLIFFKHFLEPLSTYNTTEKQMNFKQ